MSPEPPPLTREADGRGVRIGRPEWVQLLSLSGLVRGGVASIDPGCEFVGNSRFSPHMKLMGQSLAD